MCVLPGLDPRREIHKVCQDLSFFSNDEDSFLLGLYDGHGKEGEKVAEFCRKTTAGYYKKYKKEYHVKYS